MERHTTIRFCSRLIAALLVGVAATTPLYAQAKSAEKGGAADSWSHLVVSVGNAVELTTSDQQGWRNNGTGFNARVGSGAVPIKIDVTAKGGVSSFDYNFEVTVQASGAAPLLSENGTISKDGGARSFSTTWDQARNPGAIHVRVQITGGNPDFFTYFVDGIVQASVPAAAAPVPVPAAAQPSGTASAVEGCPGNTGVTASGKNPARFSGMNGQVKVLRGGVWRIAHLDMVLCHEDHIQTDEDATCILSFADMTTFVVKPDSEVIVVEPPAKDSVWRLVAGNIWANVKKMMKDGSMEIDLNQAVASIKGTTFSLSTSALSSTVHVFEGTVAFRSKATGQTVMVNADESVSADTSGLRPLGRFDDAREAADWEAVRAKAGSAAAAPSPPPALLGVSVTSTAKSVRMGEDVQTRPAVSGGTPPYTYAWFDGSRRSTVVTPVVVWKTSTAGPHVYKVVVTDAAGATAQAQTTVEVTTAGAGREAVLFSVDSTAGVSNNPPAKTVFTLSGPGHVSKIMTYHWNGGRGSSPGTIGLKNTQTGEVIGPWKAAGANGYDPTPGAQWPTTSTAPPYRYWTVQPGRDLPAGTYEVVDSEPSTWSYAPDTGKRGITYVFGWLTANAAPAGSRTGAICASPQVGGQIISGAPPTRDHRVVDRRRCARQLPASSDR